MIFDNIIYYKLSNTWDFLNKFSTNEYNHIRINNLTHFPLSQVCAHIARCYSVASQFEGCREKIQEIHSIVKELCRILYYKVTYIEFLYIFRIIFIPRENEGI